ncbi:MAG: PAS domain S-box protein, partial [Deltaproteobacteria bacterium]|nr:PAS domain S-box protein [Deltaproteobacteria bacterium]
MFETLIDVYYRIDSEGRIVMISPSITKAAGYQPEEVLGSDMRDFYVHPEERNRFIELLMKSGFVNDFEVQMKSKDGSVLWVSFNARMDKDKAGNFLGIEGIARDITERKRTRNALRESETRYRLLADNAIDVIWTVDFDNRLTYASPSFTRLVGFSVEEAKVRTMQQAFTPKSFENAIRIFTEEMEIEYSGHGDPTRSRMVELEMVHKDGNTVPVEGHFS